MAAIDHLLPRLDRVKQTAPDRWIARCPAHEDRSPSLSIREVQDRVLVHCLAGCSYVDVCGALGIGSRQLFNDVKAAHLRPSKSKPPAADLLVMIDDDVHGVAILAADFLRDRALGEKQWDELARYARRINQAAALVREFRPTWR